MTDSAQSARGSVEDDSNGQGPRRAESPESHRGVRLWVVVGTIHGCDARSIGSVAHMTKALDGCIEASGLTLLHRHVHGFEPQGVTAAAVLAESHVALHSWPEQGTLFVDIATCSDAAASRAAFDALCASIAHTHFKIRQLVVG